MSSNTTYKEMFQIDDNKINVRMIRTILKN